MVKNESYRPALTFSELCEIEAEATTKKAVPDSDEGSRFNSAAVRNLSQAEILHQNQLLIDAALQPGSTVQIYPEDEP